MSAAKKLTTTVSTKGQVVLPKAVRDRLGWKPGARLVVEETAGGVTLKPAPLFPPTTIDQVAGMLEYDGPAKTIKDMDAGVMEEARRTWAEFEGD